MTCRKSGLTQKKMLNRTHYVWKTNNLQNHKRISRVSELDSLSIHHHIELH